MSNTERTPDRGRSPPHGREQIRTTPGQTFRGLAVGRTTREVCCIGCRGSLTEGDTGAVYAVQRSEAPEWTLARWYCGRCAPARIEAPTRGVDEALVQTTFGVCARSIGQVHQLCLTAVTVVDRRPRSEGEPA